MSVSAVEIVNLSGRSPIVLICPHASNYIPPEYEGLGLPPAELERHIAWDSGAAGVTRELARILDAPAFLGTYSRLLIDLNRPPQMPSSIVERSEATDIPGNLNLEAKERVRRIERIFTPYHAAIMDHLGDRGRMGQPTVIVSVHSFTPTFHGVARPWHVGVLFTWSEKLALATVDFLARDESLTVGINEPYTVTPDTDYGLLVYADARSNPGVEFELRQDLLVGQERHTHWARTLANALQHSIQAV